MKSTKTSWECCARRAEYPWLQRQSADPRPLLPRTGCRSRLAPSGLGPRDIGINAQYGAIGATTYFGATAELQFPIFGVPREVGIKAAIFADAGTVFGNESGVQTGVFCTDPGGTIGGKQRIYVVGGQNVTSCIRDSSIIRSSVGASLLWNSPLGPIRFDYAWALSKDKADRTQAFRFSGGTRF